MTIEELKALYKKKNYPFFENGDWNINLFGIRSKNRIAGEFDDIIGFALKIKGEWYVKTYQGTVDCGAYFMKNLMHPDGAAFMVPGFYRGLWRLGNFKGTKALLQVRPVKYYRDKNLDNIMDLNPAMISEGLIGLLNHEHFQKGDNAEHIYNSSAACWVTKSRKDHQDLIYFVEQSVKVFPGDVSVALFDEE